MVLKSDATLSDVIDTLDRPKHYVGGVLKNLQKCAAIHGNAEVTIGTSGTGKRPYYRTAYKTAGAELMTCDNFFDNHVSFSRENLRRLAG